MERNLELEAAIRAHRDDPAPYLVYADWLQARGEPLGELIVLQHAGETTRSAAILADLALPANDLVELAWRWGVWRRIRLRNDADWMNDGFDAIALAREVFAHPACAALDALHIGVLRWDYNHTDVPAVLAEAGAHAWSAQLRELHLGDLSGADVDMAHHVIGDVGATISTSFPGLEGLTLHSGDQSWRGEGETFRFAGLALPRLRTLVIETCAMTTERLAALLAAELPALDTLEVWFGSRGHDAAYELADLAPLLTGQRLATVVHLGLCNADLADELAAALPQAPIAARLETLDLSMGTLCDDGARQLAAGAARFPRLASLDVSKNHLTPAGIEVLRAAFRDVTADDQKDDDLSIPGEVHRYVSVHE